MQEQEKERLKKIYEEMPEEELMEIILEDEKEYRREPYQAYELLLEVAKKRGLGEKLYERIKLKMNSKQATPKEHEFAVIKTFLYRHQAELAKGLLDEGGIEAIVLADDCAGYLSHLTFKIGAVRLLVAKEDVEKASDILKTIEDPSA